jgi:transketolase
VGSEQDIHLNVQELVPGLELTIDHLCVNTIRALALDAVQKAKSGHPGMPMGAADMAYVLWMHYLKHNPADPTWPDRDRFVLSAGHGSMLLYSLLHLSGYGLTLDDLQNFRQLGSLTPGHPEYGLTTGVETTTGPLGQGISNAVGMALAERHLASRFNRPDFPIVDHYTYVIASDGDMMVGISHEAASLAGHLKLGKLIVLYDSNHISIDGSTDLAMTEDVGKRFEAYGWHVQTVDGHHHDELAQAIEHAQAATAHPSLIVCNTHIGFGSPNTQDTEKCHGAPLGEEEVLLTKRALGWPEEPTFYVPEDVYPHMRQALDTGAQEQELWNERMQRYRQVYPDLARQWDDMHSRKLPDNWDALLPAFEHSDKGIATRAASGKTLNALDSIIPGLIGGSADLSGSNSTAIKSCGALQASAFSNRNIHYGVREHAMGAMMNGMLLHGGLIPYGGTFLIFSDYMRPAIRMAALMQLPAIYVFTHDSVCVGEDGPTHQPIEQLPSLRLIPNLQVVRPADASETALAWRIALERKNGPTALVLTRQNVPVLAPRQEHPVYGTLAPAEGALRGGYVLADVENPDVILIASGSEVSLALEAARLLAEQQIAARVVSMPCRELFDEQEQSYRDSVLPPAITARVAIEAAMPMGWERYVGLRGQVVGIDRFGTSGPYKDVYAFLGMTAERIVETALAVCQPS